MPQLIRNIDEIAKEKQRDVLFIGPENLYFPSWWPDDEACQELISWLDQNSVDWEFCAPPRSSSFEVMGGGEYVYVDIPFITGDVKYDEFSKFVGDDSDGVTKWEGIKLFCLLSSV